MYTSKEVSLPLVLLVIEPNSGILLRIGKKRVVLYVRGVELSKTGEVVVSAKVWEYVRDR